MKDKIIERMYSAIITVALVKNIIFNNVIGKKIEWIKKKLANLS